MLLVSILCLYLHGAPVAPQNNDRHSDIGNYANITPEAHKHEYMDWSMRSGSFNSGGLEKVKEPLDNCIARG
jgi:hypothetical protein